jgi:hypothetical protein
MKKTILFIFCIALLLMPTIAFAVDPIELSRPTIQWMKTALSPSVNAASVSIGTAAPGYLIKAAPSAGHYRYSIAIRNTDTTNTVYLGASGVTSSTGFPLKAGETFVMDRNYAAIYGICAAGLTATVAYFEEGY